MQRFNAHRSDGVGGTGLTGPATGAAAGAAAGGPADLAAAPIGGAALTSSVNRVLQAD